MWIKGEKHLAKKFSLTEKRSYFRNRLKTSKTVNQRAYARGFLNGSSDNHTSRHYADDKSELKFAFKDLKFAKSREDRDMQVENICYLKGCMRGYEAKKK